MTRSAELTLAVKVRWLVGGNEGLVRAAVCLARVLEDRASPSIAPSRDFNLTPRVIAPEP
jgi:hypothetical protein